MGFDPANATVLAKDVFLKHNIKNVLVPGVGYGRNAKVFADNGMKVTGIDLAKKHFGNELILYQGSVTEMPFDDTIYDGIFCHGLIYLLDKTEREKLIQDCYSQLAEQGFMIFTVITKQAHAYGQGVEIDKDRFEMFGGAKIFFYDNEAIAEEFGNAGLLEVIEIIENYPFYFIKCQKNNRLA